jgi:TDG/mug DNA glycosylase family protein
MEERIYGFPPVVGEDPKVLILGSMPSARSLESGHYYGHPRNHFWKLIFTVLRRPPEEEYGKKLEVLRRNGIALWDVIADCRRTGSLDQAIKDPVCNDVEGLIEEHPGLRLVCFNGAAAERIFFGCNGGMGNGGLRNRGRRKGAAQRYLRLPSSSPVPTRYHKTWEDKLPEWKVIARYL